MYINVLAEIENPIIILSFELTCCIQLAIVLTCFCRVFPWGLSLDVFSKRTIFKLSRDPKSLRLKALENLHSIATR